MASKRAMRFFLLDTLGDADDDSLCVLDRFVDGLELQSWRTGKGERFGDIYPKDARIYMNKENPGIELSDLLGNTRNTLIASKAFKETIEAYCHDIEVEYLPFTLYDHRKRVHSRDYVIVNPIGAFDCLDLKASDIRWGKSDPTKIVRINEHVLDKKKMKDAPHLFRIERDPTAYVVSYELAKEIGDRDFSNIFWTELELNDGK